LAFMTTRAGGDVALSVTSCPVTSWSPKEHRGRVVARSHV
jgi:hypothetical protein